MGFFSQFFKPNLPDLDTWLVSKSDDGLWQGSDIDGDAKNITAPDLTSTSNQISAIVSQRYKDSDVAAELQYAIYPWGDGKQVKYIFKIAKSKNGFLAHDIQGSNLKVAGNSLDEIVRMIPETISNPESAMLQWLRPINQLP